MSECGRSVGLRDKEGFYIADQVEQRWQSYQAATERAANIAQAKLDGEGSGVQDDWTADGGWDWACMQIRDAIRGAEKEGAKGS
jgi:hypothetical protein